MKDKRIHYSSVKFLSRILSPVCSILFYVCLVISALLLLTAFIIIFVNTPPEEMLLPPFMKTLENNGIITGYDIFIGNGIRISTDYESVLLSDIKSVIYAGISVSVAVLLVIAPIFRFLSRLLSNISQKNLFDIKNANNINYIGLCTLIGNTIVLFVSRFYNYLLVKLFVIDDSNIFLSLNIDSFGIILGLFILLIGFIYGYACQTYNDEKTAQQNQDSVNAANKSVEKKAD